jgi:phosphatidylglycerophosphate synthase
MPLFLRAVLAARRAGFERILVLTPDPAEARAAMDGFPATVHRLGETLPRLSPARLVLLGDRVLPGSQWLRALLERPIQPGQMYHDGDAAAVVDAADAATTLAELSRAAAIPDLLTALGRRFSVLDGSAAGQQRQRMVLAGPRDVPAAERWLLRGLIKETEGFMSRHVERPISLAVTRRLVSTPITPNVMTAVSLGIGLLGATFFLSARPLWQLTGALLFLLHSILDGCDGELARLRYQESRWGGLFDFWGDNAVHVAVFLCIAVGWSLAAGAAWPLALGAAAAAGTLGAATFVTRHSMPRQSAGRPLFTSVLPSHVSRRAALIEVVSNRDFIYLTVVLAALGKATWFLVLAGVGAPVYCALLVWAGRTESLGEGDAE